MKITTYREGRLLECAVVEGHIEHDAIVDVENPKMTPFEVDSEEVAISAVDGVGDVERLAVAVGVRWLSAARWSVIGR